MANRDFTHYSNQVVAQLPCNIATKKRIKEDIIEMLNERAEESRWEQATDPVDLLGKASDLASEFLENLDSYILEDTGGEWISDTIIMGLPLYHIVAQQGRQRAAMGSYRQFKVAKGIIAIGPVAVGGVAIGGLSVGLVSLGGVSIGLLALGGLAMGVIAAIGGVAVAYDLALGGMAMANNLAVGGASTAKEIAIGGVTTAKLMLYSQSYNIPSGLDEGSINAFNQFDSLSFMTKVAEIYKGLGPIKKFIIEMFAL